jgi:beta-lactamase class A
MLSRRRFVALATLATTRIAGAAPSHLATLPAAVAKFEKLSGGRLGVAVVDTGTGEQADHRGKERFPMCSTFKFLLVSAVLRRVDHHQVAIGRRLAVPAKPLLYHSPLTAPHAGGTMTLAALCHAVLVQSDNTAASLLLGTIGGPPGITKFARSIGDEITRLDRTEPALNEALAGDPRDTTSPTAMAGNLRAVLLGSILSSASRKQLTTWMAANETGLDRLRAKLPTGWRAADKSGGNGSHTSNDIAVFWPPDRAPLIVTAYITECAGPETNRATLLADIGRLIADAYT